jgi:hypothetical protein
MQSRELYDYDNIEDMLSFFNDCLIIIFRTASWRLNIERNCGSETEERQISASKNKQPSEETVRQPFRHSINLN